MNKFYIVREYLGDQFEILLKKYPNIHFLENPMYNEANNISSALIVKDLFCNAYAFEADLVLSNPDLVTKYQYTTNYLGVPVDKTDDWCLKVHNNRIIKLSLGGYNCYHMFGISYWNEEDGKKFAQHIEEVIRMPGGKECYWDQVALEYHISEYDIEIRPCLFDDIVEIDTFSDLKKIDSIIIVESYIYR